MPPTNTDDGLRAAVAIRADHPGVGVLVLSQYIEADYALELLGGDARGVGYLLKDRISDIEEFADAVRRVAAAVPCSTPRSCAGCSGAGTRRRRCRS